MFCSFPTEKPLSISIKYFKNKSCGNPQLLFCSVLHINLLCSDKRILGEDFRSEICIAQSNTGDLSVFVCGVIIYTCMGITTAGVYCFFKSIANFYRALRLDDRIKNVKELTDRRQFVVSCDGIHFDKSCFDKS